MKNFPSAFAVEKNKQRGSKPVWIMKLTLNATNYYLSGAKFTIPSFTGSTPWPASTPITTLAMVKSWGSIQQGITNWLSEFQVSEFSVTLFLSEPVLPSGTSTTPSNLSLEPLLLTYPIEGNAVELYEWFQSCTDPPQRIFHGYVRDLDNLNDLTVDLTIQDATIKLESAYIGTKVSTTTYPTADPDDVGKLIPIPYGSVKKLAPVCVKAGVATTISAYVDSDDTTIYLSEMLSNVAYTGMTFLLDLEKVTVTAYDVSARTITVTRGASSTIAVAHSSGTVIYQWSTTDPLVWILEGPITSFSAVYSRIDNFDVNITSEVTTYLGTSGNQLAAYPGKAAITISNVPATSKAVALDYSNSLSVAQGSHQHPANTSNTVVAPDTWEYGAGPSGQTGVVYSPASTWTAATGNPQNLWDGSDYSFAFLGNGGTVADGYAIRLKRSAATGSGTPVNVRAKFLIRRYTPSGFYLSYYRVVVAGVANAWTSLGRGVGDDDAAPVEVISGWYTMTSWASLNASNTYIEVYVPRGSNPNAIQSTISFKGLWSSTTAYSFSDVVRYGDIDYICNIANTGAAPLPSLGHWTSLRSYSGVGFPANMLYTVNFEVETGTASTYAAAAGVELQGSLNLTGNSVADIRIGKLLIDCNKSTTNADIFNDIITRSGQSFTVTNSSGFASYILSGAITEYQTALWWLNHLALQVQSWFAVVNGNAVLINKGNTTVVKTITACKINDDGQRALTRKKTDISEIVNKINVLYNRDWSLTSGDDAYQSNKLVENTTSQTTYGTKEKSDLFKFDFIYLDANATDLSSFYLTNYKDRHWIAEFDVFLDHSELEFGDVVRLGFLDNKTGIILAASHTPGSYDQMDVIHLTVLIA